MSSIPAAKERLTKLRDAIKAAGAYAGDMSDTSGAIDTLFAELSRLDHQVKGYQHHLRACEQIAGKALGYPWFKDDQNNFPGATEDDGVCIGDHVGDTIVEELATAYAKLRAERDEALEALKPFAARIVDVGIDEDDSDWFSNSRTPYSQSISIKVGDVRRAASLIKGGADV